ncbi:hypothetical protein MKW98_020621 [Papaver atlanticum]|uniref:Late embryogenesis abundant protein LEA-2 subgroup domain-containing protein n=1 Tax=Papaver atlanticum TaxID=357466 RepID=A0AAD4TFC1_9MAGN|nr:hypothetical protein MKW98_020621 [Papaver atlanticum]
MGCFGIICCVPKCIFKIILSILIALGLAVLIVWLILRPINHLKFNVTDASLTQFNITGNDMLHYDLAVDLNLRNPNKKIGVYYDQIEARAFYDGRRFDSVMLTPFYQGHKNTTILRPVFKGQRLLPNVQGEYNKDMVDGKFNVEVKLYLKMRFKAGVVKTTKFKPRVKCEFEVPLAGSNPAIGFTPKKCGYRCCALLCCFPRCMCNVILSILTSLGLAVLIVWLIFRPINPLKYHVDNASLTQFNVTGNDMLHYELAVDLSLRNPNTKIGVYYDQIEARALYDGQRFDSIMLTPFYQGHKNTTTLHPVFKGQRLLPNVQGAYDNDVSDGKFNIEVKLYIKMRYKAGDVETIRVNPGYKCELEVPLGSATGFTPQKCTFEVYFSYKRRILKEKM